MASYFVSGQEVIPVIIEEGVSQELSGTLVTIESIVERLDLINLDEIGEATAEAVAAAEQLANVSGLIDVLTFDNVQENDLITYSLGRWTNIPADVVLDAGNF
jgi:hypothetical protein